MDLLDFANEYLYTSEYKSRFIYERLELFPIYNYFRDEKSARSYLNTIWWQVFIRSNEYYELLRKVGLRRSFLNRLEIMIINHGREKEDYNLMIFDPLFSGTSPMAIQEINFGRSAFRQSWYRLNNDLNLNFLDQDQAQEGSESKYNLKKYLEIFNSMGEESLFYFGEQKNFKILIARKPKQEFTASSSGIFPSPLGVSPVLGGAPTSTVGAWVEDKAGRKGVTICLHAISDVIGLKNIHEGKTQVEIDNIVGTIQSLDPFSDSCFVEIDLPNVRDNARPLQGKSPRNEMAHFSGIKSGSNIKAYVQGWSPDIPIFMPNSQLKVYTSAVTNPGDSGASLIDSEGNIIGFSFYRTQVNTQPSFSCWIWADSVFQIHNLI